MKLNKRKFGVEIECFGILREVAAETLTKAGITCVVEPYGHKTLPTWKAVPDGSVSNQGFEIVSPILQGQEGIDLVLKVSKILTDLGGKVDKSCGFHVHIDASDLSGMDLTNILKRYEKHEQEIDMFFPSMRRGNVNRYCRTLKNNESIKYAKECYSLSSPEYIVSKINERYYKLNLQAFTRHGTIEFRQHHGTLDGNQMVHWIYFCLNFIERSILHFKKNEEFTEIDKSIFQILLDTCTCPIGTCTREKTYVQYQLSKLIPVEEITKELLEFNKKYKIEITLQKKDKYFEFYTSSLDSDKEKIEEILKGYLVYIKSNPKSIYAGLPEETISYLKDLAKINASMKPEPNVSLDNEPTSFPRTTISSVRIPRQAVNYQQSVRPLSANFTVSATYTENSPMRTVRVAEREVPASLEREVQSASAIPLVEVEITTNEIDE